ncbi:structural maintenance of chromosomes flexible hinge domain-containing protein GMI1 isoform X2 [Ziziphus jujuba]|nr:structural maintenance of chromosomes flexible hinge domain-containing protein GMI1 isoform X2 [Ziziphus jujuba]
MLHLEREALLGSSGSEHTWKTDGGIRNPLEEEIRDTPHGSFTKVEIFEPRIKRLDISQLQCRLKDIYFPYIQCDEASNSGKTLTPIVFQVNNVDLAEIEGGEVAVTNLNSCNGPNFVFELRFKIKQDSTASSQAYQEANACLKCVYFPVVEGKERIENILEKLEADGYQITENFENFSRVSVRRLGRLLPDARWPWLPFMDFANKKGDKADLLKRCCRRVKCFIETDAGFNPTPSKTDLAHHNSFTTALRNFGNKLSENEKGIHVKVYRDGKLSTPLHLEKAYQDWILRMHDRYDEEIDHGEDQPVLVVSPANKKSIRISSDVIRVHKILNRKGVTWKSGQRIKLLRGACAGVHKNNVYATIEYFLLGGIEGDYSGETRIICRPLGVPDENGCVLSEEDGETSLNIRDSLSVPVSVVDSGKCLAVESVEWDCQLEKRRQKAPATIDLLSETLCRELDVDGALPVKAKAGQVAPKEIVAVVRPANYASSTASANLDQKYIFKSNLEMTMEVNFNNEADNVHNKKKHIYSIRVKPSSRKDIQGLYVFPLRCKLKQFERAGVYAFTFSLIESSCKTLVRRVQVKASSKIGKWRLLSDDKSLPYNARVGSTFQPLSIACYDIYDNRIPFTSTPEVRFRIQTNDVVVFKVERLKTYLSESKLTLEIKDVVIASCELDKIRPTYEASVLICTQDGMLSVSIPCRVTPGCIQHVKAQPPILESQLLPGCMVKELKLEMFDEYDNHVRKGSEVLLNMEGLHIQDQLGLMRKVDDHGCIDLSGVLKVTAGYGKNVSISVSSDNRVVYEQQFQTEKRELRIVSKVPEFVTAGTQLENMVFEVVNSKGVVDDTIHNEENNGQSHMLTIKAELLNMDETIRYTFKHGRCTVPSIPLPQRGGVFSFQAGHSRHPELSLSVEVSAIETSNPEYDEIQSPCSDGKVLLLQDSSPFKNVKNLMVSIVNDEKVFDKCQLKLLSKIQCRSYLGMLHECALVVYRLEDEIRTIGERIAGCERNLKMLNEEKVKTEKVIQDMQASIESYLPKLPIVLSNKEEVMKQIESMGNSAAALVCHIFREVQLHEQHRHLMDDIVGLVALLGRVHSTELSRILSEYLGEDQMLAVISSSFAAAVALEKYEQNGEVDRGNALYAEAAARGKSLNGRFLVICLEDMRPFIGDFEGNDPQRKLALEDPKLPDGTVPKGFMGYAVNMVDMDVDHLYTRTSAGHGLRETLFYHLFGELHVYQTREDMMSARACISHGAVSLDGGILKENGVVYLGFGDPKICFPVETNSMMVMNPKSMELMRQIEEVKSELQVLKVHIRKQSNSREKYLKKFNRKKKKYLELMDKLDPLQNN